VPFVESFAKFSTAKRHLEDFRVELLKHIRDLKARDELNPHSFGYALLEFGEQQDVTDEDLLAEIQIMFLAGEFFEWIIYHNVDWFMFAAGHETTAHTLSWFIYSLATHPEVQAKCHAAMDEERECPADSKGSTVLLPTYVEAVFKESMRKYPILSKGRNRCNIR
jgi:hypothetical protein